MYSKKLIFSCGCDRSGTTLLGRELANIVPKSFNVPECYFFHEIMLLPNDFEVDEVLSILKRSRRYSIWKCYDSFPDLKGLSKREIFLSLIYHNYPESVASDYIIDTTPVSYLWKSLDNHFSTDYFLAIVRDARQVATSLIALDWGPFHEGEALDYWLEKTRLSVALSCSYISYNDIVSSNLGEVPSRLKMFLDLKSIPWISNEFGRAQSLDSLPVFTREQHHLIAKGFDKKKLAVKSSAILDVFYAEKLSVQILNCFLNGSNFDDVLISKLHRTALKVLSRILSTFRLAKGLISRHVQR